ncbi:MAG: DUF3786 domain-containing protein [Chloroflexi bacterium]|nr:DUF3786 domain-containing protein [Chloroflexota bacterium]
MPGLYGGHLDASMPLEARLNELRMALRAVPPTLLESRTGATYRPISASAGDFELSFFNRPIRVSYPDFLVRDASADRTLNVVEQAILAYYFHEANGVSPSHRWIAFSDLPDGAFYVAAFQSHTARELLRRFGDDMNALESAAHKLGGVRMDFAHVSFAFQVLPRVALMVACWQGDEDFPSSYRVLFDESVRHYMPTEGCAILGNMLVRRLIA